MILPSFIIGLIVFIVSIPFIIYFWKFQNIAGLIGFSCFCLVGLVLWIIGISIKGKKIHKDGIDSLSQTPFLNTDNRKLILKLKYQVENKNKSLYIHHIIDNHSINDNTISIVMTAHNRSKQVYFALQTISKSSFKDVHIVLVDDSTFDPIDLNIINNFQFYIDLIQINRQYKNWKNPCVNYNIGFQYVKGSKVVIQNSEVCHVGDVLSLIEKIVTDNNYYVFDVKASLNFETNDLIYNEDLSNTTIYQKENLFNLWYQSASNNRNYHFLTACTMETFKRIDGFSYDYSMGINYDDDDLVLKIKSLNIPIINIFQNEYNVGGIHLYHGSSGMNTDIDSNEQLFNHKMNIYNETANYIDLLNS